MEKTNRAITGAHYTNVSGMTISSHRNAFRVIGPLWGIHRSLVDSPHKGPITSASMDCAKTTARRDGKHLSFRI